MAAALEAHQVHKLMIRRPGDVWKYLWVKALDVPTFVSTKMASKREETFPHAFNRCRWLENSIPLNLFDGLWKPMNHRNLYAGSERG